MTQAITILFVTYTVLLYPLSLYGKEFQESWSAQAYDQNSALQAKSGLSLLASLRFMGHEDILDVGCGNGLITAELSVRTPHGSVLGIDAAPDMIAFSKARFDQAIYSNLHFQVLDVCSMNFLHQFDVVTALSSLHWVKDIHKAVSAIAQSLKPTGRALLYMGLKNNLPLVRALEEVLDEYGLAIPWYLYNVEEILGVVSKAGLTILNHEVVYSGARFKNQDAFEAWIEAMPYGHALPVEERKALLKKIVKRYLQYLPANDDGSIDLCMPNISITARVV
jgi:trans-aconitate 2-methyltransferase